MIAPSFTAAALCAALPAPSYSATVCAVDLRQRAHIDLASAQVAFERLDLDDAARHYGAAVQKLHRVAGLTGDVELLPNSLSMLAATYMLLQDNEAATLMAQRVVALNPDFAPPRHIYNPDMLAQFHAAAQSATADRTVTVIPSPGNSHIYVDGHFVGTGMVSLEVNEAIPHYVFATSQGSLSQGMIVDPSPLAAEVHITLVPPPGAVDLVPPCG